MNRLERIIGYLEHSEFPCVVCDADVRIVFANQAMPDLCGYSVDSMIGKNPGRLLQGEKTDPETVIRVRERLTSGVPFEFSITNYREDGDEYDVGVFVIPFVDGHKSRPVFVGVSRELQSVDESAVGHAPPEFGQTIGEVLELINGC